MSSSDFHVDIFASGPGAALFRVSHNGQLVTICGVAWTGDGARDLWAKLELDYDQVLQEFPYVAINRLVGPPAHVPWMGVILLPAMWSMTPENVCWIGDFEACFAWTIVESAGDLLATR